VYLVMVLERLGRGLEPRPTQKKIITSCGARGEKVAFVATTSERHQNSSLILILILMLADTFHLLFIPTHAIGFDSHSYSWF